MLALVLVRFSMVNTGLYPAFTKSAFAIANHLVSLALMLYHVPSTTLITVPVTFNVCGVYASVSSVSLRGWLVVTLIQATESLSIAMRALSNVLVMRSPFCSDTLVVVRPVEGQLSESARSTLAIALPTFCPVILSAWLAANFPFRSMRYHLVPAGTLVVGQLISAALRQSISSVSAVTSVVVHSTG